MKILKKNSAITMLLAVLLSGCSSSLDTSYYLLSSESSSAFLKQSVEKSESDKHRSVLLIEFVTVPDYLASTGIVYQTSNVQYAIAKNHLWASALEQQLSQILLDKLNGTLPGWIVTSLPLEVPQDKLRVMMNAFHGRYDGRVIISGEWMLEHDGEWTKHTFWHLLPQQQDGYDALVESLSKGWQAEVAKIAETIKKTIQLP